MHSNYLVDSSISNTNDHVRNYGFVLIKEGWTLSPASDLNPFIDKDGLALNIDTGNNALDFELVESVGKYFRLDKAQMDEIINQTLTALSNCKLIAKKICFSRVER
jgi:serine/threonine-protein kinase HipA